MHSTPLSVSYCRNRKVHARARPVITDDANLLSQVATATVTATNLLERLDLERLDISNRLAVDPKRRANLGQFFTLSGLAAFMASMLKASKTPKEFRILDPGGGNVVCRRLVFLSRTCRGRVR